MTTPEQRARKLIDQLLEPAGWRVQDRQDANLAAARGVAVREFPLSTGFADYLLFIEGKAIGVVEGKAEGATLSFTNGLHPVPRSRVTFAFQGRLVPVGPDEAASALPERMNAEDRRGKASGTQLPLRTPGAPDALPSGLPRPHARLSAQARRWAPIPPAPETEE